MKNYYRLRNGSKRTIRWLGFTVLFMSILLFLFYSVTYEQKILDAQRKKAGVNYFPSILCLSQ